MSKNSSIDNNIHSNDTIKESLGLLVETTADNFAEFAIDSDDELDNVTMDIPLDSSHSPTTSFSNHLSSPSKTTKTTTTTTVTAMTNPSSTSITNSNSNPNSQQFLTSSGQDGSGMRGGTQLQKVETNDDPLTAFFHSNDGGSTTAHSQQQPQPSQPSHPSQPPHINATATNGTSSDGIAVKTNPTINAANNGIPVTNQSTYTSNSLSANNPSSVSQSLSSTFSSFASKFQDAVSSATGTPTTSLPLPLSLPPGVYPNGNVDQTQSMPHVMKSVGIPRTASSSSNMIQSSPSYTSVQSNAPSVYNAYSQTQTQTTEPKPQPIYQIANAALDVDNTMKSALITSAVGKLLPGERVIVFLSHLLQVRDSSSPQTSIGSSTFQSNGSNNRIIWCCAITFYRLILFSYVESEFAAQSPNDNHNHNAPNISSQTPQDVYEQQMKNWIDSASVSSVYQHVHSVSKRANGKHHYILQMPLASIDRVEKSTDFGMSSNSGIGNQMSFSASLMSGNTVTSNYDSVGGAVARGTLIVYGKDNGRFIQFTAASYADCMRVYENLNTYAFPGRRNLGYLFAFESRREEVMDSAKPSDESNHLSAQNGAMRLTARATPRRYDAIAEFRRMVSGSKDGNVDPNCPWTPVSRANCTYNLCSSYPSVLFAPSTVNDEKPEGMRLLRDTASFRSGGRMQTMSWASRFDGASLWRSAQPKVGLQGNRSTADELFMKRIAESAALANSQAAAKGLLPPRPSLAFLKMLTGGINESDLILGLKDGSSFNEQCLFKIFDLRPKSSAMANRTAGYGYENTSHYKHTTLSFFGIGNIHAVRDSYKKLSSLCASPATNDVQWMQLVEDTKWLSLVRLILSASWQAAFHVRYNRLPVLIHCSHGWDRTSQVSALAQIFLDPYYRTRAGFSCLVEKDFLALGHPFHTRCGHGEGKGSDQSGSGSSGGNSDEISQIFLQFLDCVFQIVNQYPDYFEFNTKYLLLLSEHIYSCRFGTLLCDTEREREVVASIRQRTYCLWEYLDGCPDLVNKNFSSQYASNTAEVLNGKGCLLMPLSSLLRNVTLWTERHCMHSAKPTLRTIPVPFHSNDLPDDRLSQPLCESKDAENCFLRDSLLEIEKWKKIAMEKDTELSLLKQQLKEMNEKN